MPTTVLTCVLLACAGSQQPQDPDGGITGVLAGLTQRDGTPAFVALWTNDYDAGAIALRGEVRGAPSGEFRFPAVLPIANADWGNKAHLLLARQGEAAVGVGWLRGGETPPTRIELAMVAPFTATGRVTTAAGTALADATVRVSSILRGYDGFSLADAPPPWRGRSGADGSFTIRGLPGDVRICLEVTHPDFVHAIAEVTAAGKPCAVRMRPGSRIKGRILGDDGRPAVGAAVWCGRIGDAACTATGSSDADGRFLLTGLAPGNYHVVAQTATKAGVAQVVAVAGETVACPVTQLRDLITVRGHLVDGHTGEAVRLRYGSIGLYGPTRPQESRVPLWARVQQDGVFEVRVIPGSYSLVVLGLGEWRLDPQERLEIGAGATAEVVLRAWK